EFRALMCDELRALHDRLHATTLYVTHDQIEAMAMADKIAVMNHGVIEQLGTPQGIYDRPVSMFVADFIGSPPMNFLNFHQALRLGECSARLNGTLIEIPEVHEELGDRPLTLGARPEDVRLISEGGLRGQVFGSEYLGTTQVVTVTTDHGRVKARIPSDQRVVDGGTVGLTFQPRKLSVFDQETGRAVKTALFDGAAHG
ncbi:MAG TPA: TOBE domain-containing protein, partial [Dongiaceae bacterium]